MVSSSGSLNELRGKLKMKRNLVSIFVIGLVAGLFTVFSAIDANGQGRYVGQYSRARVDQIIREMENAADEFRRDFRNELDRSNLSSSQKRTYRNQVDNFERSTDRLRSNFDSNNDWWRSRNQVQNMVAAAAPLNNTMNSIRFRRNIERQWNRLRREINTVADTYDLPGIAGGGWNGGGGGGGGWGGGQTVNPPNWAQGTFYGTGPGGEQITLTISPNGSITANIGGSMSYGRYTSGNFLNINGAVARVTRQGNGILTTRTDTNERIAYTRTGGGGWGGGNQANPPSWARGTFYGTGPGGERITLSIQNNGSITVNIGGGIFYGYWMSGDMINIDGAVASVSRIRNGISTRRNDTGEVINYRR